MINFIIQAVAALVIGFITSFKWLERLFFMFFFIILISLLFVEPAQAGIALNEGLFTWWRWVITIPCYLFGNYVGKKLKESFK